MRILYDTDVESLIPVIGMTSVSPLHAAFSWSIASSSARITTCVVPFGPGDTRVVVGSCTSNTAFVALLGVLSITVRLAPSWTTVTSALQPGARDFRARSAERFAESAHPL